MIVAHGSRPSLMPRDERYQARAAPQEPEPQAEFRRASLCRVTGCPARPGYRELHFDVAGTWWSWCFPGPAQTRAPNPAAEVVMFRPGPHGLIVRAVTDEPGGLIQPAAIDHAVAADLADSGVPVFIHRSLLGQETGRATRSAGSAATAEE